MDATKRIYHIALAIVFVGAPFCLHSQPKDSITLGDKYFALVNTFYGENSDSVFYYLEKATQEFQNTGNKRGYVGCLNAYTALSFNLNRTSDRKKYSQLAIEEARKHLDSTDTYYGSALNNSSYLLFEIGDHLRAIDQFKEYGNIARLAKDSVRLCSALKNVASAYIRLGDFDQGIQYFEELSSLANVNNELISVLNRADNSRKIGNAYFEKKDYERSKWHLNEALRIAPPEIVKEDYTFNNFLININYDLARIYLIEDNLDSIQYFISQANEFCTDEYDVLKGTGNQLLGTYYMNNDNYDRAEYFLTKARSIANERFKNYSKHILFSELNNLLATLYVKKGDTNKAIDFSVKSIDNLKSSTNSSTSDRIPSIESIYNPSVAIKAFKNIHDAYLIAYNETQQIELLKSSYKSLVNATKLIPSVRKSYQEESSLLRYSEIAASIYESCIATSLELFKQTQEQQYLEEAFYFNEKSKAILLLESINKSQASSRSNIPEDLLQKEKDFRLKITTLNKQIYNQENLLKKDTFTLQQLKRQLFNDSEEFDLLVRTLEKDYPKYYESRYANTTATLRDVQDMLPDDKTQIIEFFSGEKEIYVFSVSKSNIEVNIIHEPEKHLDDLLEFKRFLSTPPSGNMNDSYTDYLSCANRIYKTFLEPAIWPQSKHLVIITDGIFGYIPFEALITTRPNSNEISFALDDLSYLFEDYNISYSYSSTLFLNSLANVKTKNDFNFIGIAPSFDVISAGAAARVCNDNALYSLQCSEDEVMQIQNKLGGKILVGEEATLQNAKDLLSNSKIIHLATHACLDDSNPEFNKIYLFDDYLSNNDLYNLQLNSELAVLSACETGSGKLAKGEGVMSLARGFIHAGCPSIVMSLWSIDDCATSKIMVNFYKELLEGKPKTDALREAKLRYIKTAKKANKHPYYWAAFVQIGNYQPVQISTFSAYLPFLAGGFIMLLGLFYFWRKKTS